MQEKHGWANPSPAGLVALAVACLTFSALFGGKISPGGLGLMGCWLFGGFIIQIVVAVIELKEGKTTGGNVFLFFSAFFMLTGALEMFFKYFAFINRWPIEAHVDGYAWAVLSIILLFYTVAYLRESPLVMNILVLMLDVAVFFIATMDLGWIAAATFKPIISNILLVATGVTIYLSSAILLNTSFGRAVLPLGKPLMAPRINPVQTVVLTDA
jgi:succinate-acetate transporter protein